MTDYKKFTTEQPLVAIDVAKRFHDVLVRWPEGKPRPSRPPTGARNMSICVRFCMLKTGRSPWPRRRPPTFIDRLPMRGLQRA